MQFLTRKTDSTLTLYNSGVTTRGKSGTVDPGCAKQPIKKYFMMMTHE